MLTLLEPPKVSIGLEEDSVVDSIHASGEGVTFGLGNLRFNPTDFYLQVERDSQGDLKGIGVVLPAVQPEVVALLGTNLPSPLDPLEYLDFEYAQVVLVMRRGVIDAIRADVAAMTELQQLLDMPDSEGNSVVFNLKNYVVDSVAGVEEAGMVDPTRRSYGAAD